MAQHFDFLDSKPVWSETITVDYDELSVKKIAEKVDDVIVHIRDRYLYIDKPFKTKEKQTIEAFPLTRDITLKELFWASRTSGGYSHNVMCGRESYTQLLGTVDTISGYCLSKQILEKFKADDLAKYCAFFGAGILVSPYESALLYASLWRGEFKFGKSQEDDGGRLRAGQLICVNNLSVLHF